jgi:hypothetical protein
MIAWKNPKLPASDVVLKLMLLVSSTSSALEDLTEDIK